MPTVYGSTDLYYSEDPSFSTTQSIDQMIDDYIDKNTDKIRNILLSSELKKKRCKVSKTFRNQYTKRDLLRLKH